LESRLPWPSNPKRDHSALIPEWPLSSGPIKSLAALAIG
jgi:hypothetical protein